MPSRNLQSRILAATIIVPIVVLATWVGGMWFSALVTFGGVLMIFEWSRLVERAEFSLGFYALTLTAIIALSLAAMGKFDLSLWVILGGASVAGLVEAMRKGRVYWALLGAFYIILPCVILLWLRNDHEHGRYIAFFTFVAVWLTDIGAYGFGKTMGGRLLVPKLSPNKTWSGAIGGVICGALGGVLITLLFQKNIPVPAALFIAMLIGIMTVLGDITESAIKRHFGVKDASGLIPGHGGLLDRVDGMIFAVFMMGAFMVMHDFRTGAF